MKNRIRTITLSLIVVVATAVPGALAATSILDLGVAADGQADGTEAVQAALDSGKTDLSFPSGTYLLGPLTLPADTRITFDPRARIIPNAERINYTEVVETKGKKRKVRRKKPLFTIAGDRVRLEGLRYDYSAGATEKDPVPATTLVHAEGVSDPVVSGFHTERSLRKEGQKVGRIIVFNAKDCRNVVMENSGVTGVSLMLYALQCRNVVARGNWMIGGATMTTFAFGSESLRHHDNWSRNVGYQCVWRGGSPDPSRKAPKVPHGTANVVHRDVQLEDEAFIPHTRGIFDVNVQNNYAEYGTVLCWGNKGRQVLVDGNIARFMWDYSYGSEGDENAVYSNNISVNSAVAGIMSLYWGEKLLITGNLVVVRHEPFRTDLTHRPPSTYMGQFIRLHHGPPNDEDKYGSGSALITNNLFVNELAERPSGVSIEAGRDVTFSGNKMINGLLRKSDELARVKASQAGMDADEFASLKAATPDGEEPMTILRRTGADLSRLTVMGNEFITRQPGEKPVVLVNGSVSSAIIKNNVFRKEETYHRFTEAEREMEKGLPRFMLFSEDDFDTREHTNARPATAIGIAPFTAMMGVVQDNFILGWKNAITAENTAEKGRSVFIVTGNTTEGAIQVSGDESRTIRKVGGNLEVPALPAP